MKKQLFAVLLGASLTIPTLALAADDLADKYFSNNNPTLTARKRRPLPSPSGGRPVRPPA